MSDNVTISVTEPAPLDVSLSIDAPAVHEIALTVLSGAKGDKGDPGQDGIIGADGADGAQGPPGNDGAPGPSPAGTGIVTVIDGVLQTPSHTTLSLLSDVALSDPNNGQISLKVQNAGDYSQSIQAATTGNSSYDLSSYGTDKNAQFYTNVSADGGVDSYIEHTIGSAYTYSESASNSTQVYIEAGNNNGVLYRLNPTANDGETAYVFGTSLAHTSGNLSELKNNGTLVFAIDYAGVIQSATIPAAQVTGLGTAATTNSSAYDSAGAASSAQTFAIQRANHTGTQTLSTISDAGNAAGKNVGTTAGTVAAGDDSRLSNSRTPTAHAASHTAAGSDPLTISASQVSGLGTLATQSGTFSGTHSGNSSGTNTGDQTNISGNAATATALQTARAINGVNFDGTAPITVAAAAGTLTGATLASNVLSSSLTSVGTLATLTVTATISGSISGNAATVTTNANLTGPVTSVGNATAITDAAVTLAKMANLAQDTIIGRQTASTGVPEAITCTAAGRSVIAGASASAQRTTLGVGSTDAVTHATLALSQGAITTDAQVLSATSTWNGSGVAFTGIKFNVTDTASATASALVDLQVGGVTKFKIRKDGANLLPTTSASNPLMACSAATTTGFYSSGSAIAYADAGSLQFYALAGSFYIYPSNGQLVFARSGNNDVILTGDSAATLQMGADAASPIAQTLKACDGVGTDKVGASLTLQGGQSTGTGRGGDFQLRTALSAASTGASANGYSVREFHSAKPVDLSEGVDTQFCSITLAAGTVIGLHLSCTAWASDGTDFQSLQSVLSVCAVNKAGTLTISAVSQSDTGPCNSAGTLTPVTYTAVASGNNLVLKCNATSSLTQTVLRVKWSILSCNSTDVATVTPS